MTHFEPFRKRDKQYRRRMITVAARREACLMWLNILRDECSLSNIKRESVVITIEQLA